MAQNETLANNVRALKGLGINVYIADATKYQRPSKEIDDSDESNRVEVNPLLLSMEGLRRIHAIPLFRQFNAYLNAVTPYEDRTLQPLEEASDENLEDKGRELFEPLITGQRADYVIQVEETDTSKFKLEITPSKTNDFDVDALVLNVQGAYATAMSRLDLRKSTIEEIELGIVEDEIRREAQKESGKPEIPFVPSAVELLSVVTRKENAERYDRIRNNERRQKAEDLQEIEFLCDIFGLKGMNRVDEAQLVELWRDRKRNHIAMVDLFLYSVSRIQEVNGTRAYYFVTTPDLLISYAERTRPIDLRRAQEAKSVDILANLGVERDVVNETFDRASSPLEKAQLRLLSWLCMQPVMAGFNTDVKKMFKQSWDHAADFDIQKLMDQATDYIEREITVLQESFNLQREGIMVASSLNETSLGQYDRTIPQEQNAYLRKLNFLDTLLKLCIYLFTDHAMNKYLK